MKDTYSWSASNSLSDRLKQMQFFFSHYSVALCASYQEQPFEYTCMDYRYFVFFFEFHNSLACSRKNCLKNCLYVLARNSIIHFMRAKFHACRREYSFTWHALTCMADLSDTCVCIYTMPCVYTHFSENYVWVGSRVFSRVTSGVTTNGPVDRLSLAYLEKLIPKVYLLIQAERILKFIRTRGEMFC